MYSYLSIGRNSRGWVGGVEFIVIPLRYSGSNFIVSCSCDSFSQLNYHLLDGTSGSYGERERMLDASFFPFCILFSTLMVSITHLYSDSRQLWPRPGSPSSRSLFLMLLPQPPQAPSCPRRRPSLFLCFLLPMAAPPWP